MTISTAFSTVPSPRASLECLPYYYRLVTPPAPAGHDNSRVRGAVLDRELLVKILGMAGSLHDGEALAAVRKAYALIRDAETTWDELLQPFAQLEVATEAARQLYEENEVLRRAAMATPSALASIGRLSATRQPRLNGRSVCSPTIG